MNKEVFATALLIAAACLMAAGGQRPQTQPSSLPYTPCDIGAYVVDSDPEGLNVRTGPGKEFPSVATLTRDTMVDVKGVHSGWVLIGNAEDLFSTEDQNVFKGSGWVYGMLLGTATYYRGIDPHYRVKVYRLPSHTGGIVGKLAPETEVKIVGCRGHWVQIKHRNLKGWLDPDSHCGNVVTTCS
jgi:SH3-like domain-containing protein